jgi:hypothetical protein
MIGSNIIELCQAEVWVALETYLNEKVLRPEHSVTVIGAEVVEESYSQLLRVRVEPLKAELNKPAVPVNEERKEGA